jgi:hypothetical protein
MPCFPVSRTWCYSFQRYFVETVNSGAQTRPNGGAEAALAAAAVFLRASFLSIVVAFLMLAWPVSLGSTSAEQVSALSFMVFQGLYTLISYPVLLMQYHYGYGGYGPKAWIIIGVLGQALIQGFFLLYLQAESVGSLAMVRLVGEFVYCATILLFYLGLAIREAWTGSFAVRGLSEARPEGIPQSCLLRRILERLAVDGGPQLEHMEPETQTNFNFGASFAATSAASMDTVAIPKPNASFVRPGAPEDRAHHGANDDSATQFFRLAARQEDSLDSFVYINSDGDDDCEVAAMDAANPKSVNDPRSASTVSAADVQRAAHATLATTSWPELRDALTTLDALLVARALGVSSWSWLVTSNRPMHRVVINILFAGGIIGIYFWVQWCAQALFAQERSSGLVDTFKQYLLFSSVMIVGGSIVQVFARVSDSFKMVSETRHRVWLQLTVLEPTSVHASGEAEEGEAGAASLQHAWLTPSAGVIADSTTAPHSRDGLPVSLELFSHIMLSMFYAIFFRALFQHLEAWTDFAAVSVMHLAMLGLLYPLRMTRVYFSHTDRFQRRYRKWPIVSILYDPSNAAQWNTRIALDFVVRFAAGLTASLAFVVMTAFLRFGYNRDRYTYFGSGLSSGSFAQGMAFVSASVGVEVLGLLVMAHVTRRLIRGGILSPFMTLVTKQRSYQYALVACGCHIITDVFLAHVKLGSSVA